MGKALKNVITTILLLALIAGAFVIGNYLDLDIASKLGLKHQQPAEPVPDTEPHSVEDVITVETVEEFDDTGAGSLEITQQKLPYVVDVDFGPVLLNEAQLEKKLIIMTQKANATEKHTKAGLFSFPLFKQAQAIIFHGEGTFFVDLSTLSSDDFAIDNEKKVITITIPKPELTVKLLPKETEFMDSVNGMLRFGQMQITPEIMTELEIQGMESITKTLEADKNTWATAEKFAKLSVKEIYEPLVTAQVQKAVEEADDEFAVPAYYTISVEIK